MFTKDLDLCSYGNITKERTHSFTLTCYLVGLISLRLSLRNANLQAKANMRKAAQEEVLNFSIGKCLVASKKIRKYCFFIHSPSQQPSFHN